MTAVLLVFATSCVLSYVRDCAELRGVARAVTAGSSSAEKNVSVLLHFVYHIPQTAENESYFLAPFLRATPLQALAGGGDCADKSRLLAALLRQIGVEATMVMCFDPRTNVPTHTVVCALLGEGRTMVVDPAYDLDFPRDDGGYHGLTELRRDPSILEGRLTELRARSPRRHPIHSYNAALAPYASASSVNWHKNTLTRLIHDATLPWFGDALYAWPRPVVLEEPKLAVALLSLACAGMVAAAPWGLGRIRAMHRGPSALRRRTFPRPTAEALAG